MFLSYYNLQTNPFKISSDPKFLWMGEKHKEALATLTYGISDNKGFLLLTGDVGSGKTTLINTLINNLDESVLIAVISDPGLSPIDFFNHIAHLFNFKKRFRSKGDFIIHFSMFLNNVYMENKKVLLIIDEAQRLPNELLEEVRLLSNIEKQDTKLINIFFVGQNEFNSMLLQDANRALRQRLTLNYHIDSLDERETLLYIQHRLKVAGGKTMLFTAEAVSEIFKYSGGYPRQINIICDMALLSGYVKGEKKIGHEIIKECTRDLKIPEKIVKITSHKDEEKYTTPIQKSSTCILPPQPVYSESEHPPRRRSGKAAIYIMFLLILSLAALLSYTILFHPQKLDSMINTLHQKITVLYSTILEQATTDTPQKTAVSEDEGTVTFKVSHPTPNNSTEISDNKSEKQPDSNTFESQKDNTIPIDTSAVNPDNQVSQVLSGEQNIADKEQITETEQKTDTVVVKDTDTEASHMKIDPTYLTRKVTISFGHNSNDLTLEHRQELIKMTQLLKEDRSRKIRIIGHSDSMGNASYNMQLSEFRANIVKSFMFGSGAEHDQLIVVGKGGTEPVADNGTVQGRQMNRRVELEFILP